MASEEHKGLSDFIKSVHEDLRQNSRIWGTNVAWEKHCQDAAKLQKYAHAMKNLACNYWETNSEKREKVVSRVTWTWNMCVSYFDEIDKYREKEIIIAEKIGVKASDNLTISEKPLKLKLLDVGSCYNAFKKYNEFEVTAIDIAPASDDVLKCDFLNVHIGIKNIIINNEIKEMEGCSFDIIVFSLLLEYIPSPEHRLNCCKKAYDLLRFEGILIIITPDSKHVGANAKLMKAWRYLLARIGFSRIKYEKMAHIHCMAFRKALQKEITERWCNIHEIEIEFDEMYIPQDFKQNKLDSVSDNFNNQETRGFINEELLQNFNL